MNSIKLFALAGLLAYSASGADFFPLATGNTWTYQESKTGQKFTVRVGLPFFIGERVYYSLTGYVDSRVLVRMDGKNQLIYLNEETGNEHWLTSFEPFDAGWWDSPLRTCTFWAQTQVSRGAHDGPAGPMREVLDIRYRTFNCADAGIVAEQYAENIGMVRRVETSFAGPRTFDLVSARVGKVRIDTAVKGQFKVAVEAGRENLAITLGVEMPAGEQLKLQFASGQEYDAVLRDSDGREVWKWSADKMFTMALHDLTVGDGWSASLSAPRPPAGEYTLHAWLTAIGNAPPFAATAAVSVQ